MQSISFVGRHVWASILGSGLVALLPLMHAHGYEGKEESPGIAAKYPGDRGIESDERVLFTENFEKDSIEAIGERWEMVRDAPAMSLSTDCPDARTGKQSLLMTQTAEAGTGADLYRRLSDGHDQLFTRMYVKFAEDCEPIHHFGTCVGGNSPSTPWPTVRAGQPTQGDKGFWVGIEPFGEAWRWDYYLYWHQMRGSPPRGQTWGNSFIQDPNLKVRRGEWTCVEFMVKMNDLNEQNGEMALWIDGKQVSHLGKGFPRGKWVFDKFYPGQGGEGVFWDHGLGERRRIEGPAEGAPFEGFQFRTSPKLNINFLWLYVYITKATPGHRNRIWFDDVVVAKEYIGPIWHKE